MPNIVGITKRWTESGNALALGPENQWQLTLTGRLGQLGRYHATDFAMKFPVKFSIAALLTLIAMVAGYLAGYQGGFRIPPKFSGVWRITSATDDGLDFPLAADPDGSLSAGECPHIELIFSDNRLLIVSTDGEAMVCETREIPNSNELKLELTGFGYHGKRDGPHYAIMKRSGQNLVFAWADSNATRIDPTRGGKQIVYTAVRPDSSRK